MKLIEQKTGHVWDFKLKSSKTIPFFMKYKLTLIEWYWLMNHLDIIIEMINTTWKLMDSNKELYWNAVELVLWIRLKFAISGNIEGLMLKIDDNSADFFPKNVLFYVGKSEN